MSQEGKRYNEGKALVAAVPPLWTYAQGEVLTMGAAKYDRNNWMKGMSYAEVADSLERHWLAWKWGSPKDLESGLSHLAHVGVNASFLHHFDKYPHEYQQFDDRPHHIGRMVEFLEELRSE